VQYALVSSISAKLNLTMQAKWPHTRHYSSRYDSEHDNATSNCSVS